MPTNGNDIVYSPVSGPLDLMAGADTFYWDPAHGSATVSGGSGGENFDDNIYGDKSGGDVLRLVGDQGVFLRLDTSEDGTVTAGANVLTFDGFERLHLGNGNDTVRMGAAVSEGRLTTLFTYGGNDNIVGSSGADFIDPGAGNDAVWAGDGSDHVQASRGNDTIYGGAGEDNIRWGQGTAEGNSGTGGLAYGNDWLYGGAGQDVVNLWAHDWDGTGITVTIGRVFADSSMQGTGSLNFTGVVEEAYFIGFEQVWSHQGNDLLIATNADIKGDFGVRVNLRWGDDRLLGSVGNDTLEGGDGRDTITGGRGDDLISAANDYYSATAPGDGDVDTLIFRDGDGHDTLLAFDVGVDVLDLGGRAYTASQTGQGTLLSFSGGDTILLSNVFDFA